MIDCMPKKRPQFVVCETTRHGRRVWYFRRDKGQRIRLPGDFGSDEWKAAYDAALIGETVSKRPPKAQRGTLKWLIDRYLESAAWAALATATRETRQRMLRQLIETAGEKPYDRITRATIAAGRDRRAKGQGHAAKNYMKTVRGLFGWAADAGMIDQDPTLGVKSPKTRTIGFHTWTVDEVDRFYAKWPLGTRERLAIDLMLFTGLRRGDVVKLGRQHIQGDVIVYKPGKTSASTGVSITIPVVPPLRASIDATTITGLTLIETSRGQPFAVASFGNWFGNACRAAGVPGRAHGLRKAAATLAAEGGATETQMMALFGWTSTKMASLYTRAADRVGLAKGASDRMIENITRSKKARTSE